MPYEFDVFISYRRHGLWPQWVEKRFLPLFDHWLGEELGRDARIWWDHDLETGNDWPTDLGEKLAYSSTLVPLWSRQYFSSQWCKTELALMCAREATVGFGSKKRSERLIVPAIIHDGDEIPKFIRSIQAAKLQDYSNAWVTDSSPTLEALSEKIKRWVPDVKKAIMRAPAHDPSWVGLAVDAFFALFNMPEAKQETLPSLGEP